MPRIEGRDGSEPAHSPAHNCAFMTNMRQGLTSLEPHPWTTDSLLSHGEERSTPWPCGRQRAHPPQTGAALNGYTAPLSAAEARRLAADPSVACTVEQNQTVLATDTTQSGAPRTT
ncbi:hypothetical protein M2271_005191 [Streptomyces sp. LBL]|nr:hypothetical protein [Streptomyces sp. LBL]